MEKITEGKTKDLYKLDDGNYQLVFKDDMTGTNGVFDPGANTVGLTVDGAGIAGLEMSVYFFKVLEDKGYKTQFISTENNKMTIKPASIFGKGLEVICRFVATGSLIRRYGEFITEGSRLDSLVEMTLKNDEGGDPLITEDSLIAIGILKPGEYSKLKKLTQEISKIIKDDLAEKNLELWDIKLEFGKDPNGEIILIDEISGGNMRVKRDGVTVSPLELSALITQT